EITGWVPPAYSRNSTRGPFRLNHSPPGFPSAVSLNSDAPPGYGNRAVNLAGLASRGGPPPPGGAWEQLSLRPDPGPCQSPSSGARPDGPASRPPARTPGWRLPCASPSP